METKHCMHAFIHSTSLKLPHSSSSHNSSHPLEARIHHSVREFLQEKYTGAVYRIHRGSLQDRQRGVQEGISRELSTTIILKR